tara:strand:+ start:29 stop:472 length:444 start_codon:yes stop_codon:yes gene_type:complete
MNKKIAFFILCFTMYSCQNNSKEIFRCNIDTQNGIGYVDGKKYNGTCNIYFNDSILWKTRTYKRGYMIKESSYYLPGGELEYIGESKNGFIHGDFISYYPNGNVSIEGEVDRGKYIGEWKYYDDDGSLNKTLIYNKEGLKIDSIGHK